MLSAIFGAFVAGTVLFWIITAAFVIWAFVTVEKESIGWAIACLVIYLIFIEVFGRVNIVEYSFAHPLNILGYIGVYLALGLVWSLIKWWVIFLPEKLEEYKSLRKEWLRSQVGSRKNRIQVPIESSTVTKETPVPDEWLDEWKSHTKYTDIIPKVKDNKAKIVQWFAFWPISFIWSLLSKFFRRLIEKIVDAFKKLYDLAVKQVFSGINSKEYKE